MITNRLIAFFTFVLVFNSFAQQMNFVLDQQLQNSVEKRLYHPNAKMHTSIRPFRYDEVNNFNNVDSIHNALQDSNRLYLLPTSLWAKVLIWSENKLFDENLIEIDSAGFKVRANLLLNLRLGRDFENNNYGTWQNTRGYWIEGSFNNKLFFNSMLFENQARFLPHELRYAGAQNVVFGQGRYKNFREDLTSGALDWSFAMGALSYRPNQFFNFEFGHGKHFLGDGYRSLLLSDHAFPSVYFKTEANFWKMKYVMLIQRNNHFGFAGQGDRLLDAKFNAIHYLSWNVNKKFNISLFENITWKITEKRAFDLNYLNPVVIMRPIEWQQGSADRAMLGLNTSYKINPKVVLYGQFVLDDLNIQALKRNDNYWGNKYGFQTGAKVFDFLKIENLNFQAEYNYVRPYTYSHFDSITSHTQMNEPMAHPLGANFKEFVSFLRYNYKRSYFQIRYSSAIFGLDTNNINHGGNILYSYNTNRVDVRGDGALYGQKTGQGLQTNLQIFDARYSYLINPKAHFMFEIGMTNRLYTNARFEEKNIYFYLGLRTVIHNFYNDFF